MPQLLKQLLTGLTVPREYVCLGFENLLQALSVFVTSRNEKYFCDVTDAHVFLGYKPLLIAVALPNELQMDCEEICLNFTITHFELNSKWKNFYTDKRCVARLVLKRKNSFEIHKNYFLYEGIYGSHHFLNPVHQFVNHISESLRKRAIGNVNLPGNLYDQVRIAYSVPRVISVITVGDDEQMNMFPTDLHGSLTSKYYVSSLRIGGKANDQVECFKKIILSFMPISDFSSVYALGKNHMREMKSANTFEVKENSEHFNIPVPANTLHYLELAVLHSFDCGIHRIHMYEKINEHRIKDGITLSHIHQYYAQWRLNREILTEFF